MVQVVMETHSMVLVWTEASLQIASLVQFQLTVPEPTSLPMLVGLISLET